MAVAEQEGLLRRTALEPSANPTEAPTVGGIKKRFRSLFPHGALYEAGGDGWEVLAGLSSADRRELMYGVIQYSKNCFAPTRRARFDVTTFSEQGEIRLVFGIPRSDPRRLRSEWRSFINAANVRRVVNTPPETREDLPMSPIRLKRSVVVISVLAVVTTVLCLASVEDRVTGSFRIRPETTANLCAPVAGFLRVIEHVEGDRVTAGTVIARIEVPDQPSRVVRKRAELEKGEALLRPPDSPTSAGKSAERGGQTGQGSGRERETGGAADQARMVAGEARLARLRKELNHLRELEESLIVRSPLDGVITTPGLAEKVGRYLRKGELICQVADLSKLQAEIDLPEDQIARVELGQPVVLKARALPYEKFHATVGRVAPIVIADETENTLCIYCSLDQSAAQLKPGMTGYARIHLGSRSVGSLLIDRMMRLIRTEFWW
jgi:multidrug efflux pump subunit AcrA (membrane-fusion protein)